MNDRDSLHELFEIVSGYVSTRKLPMTALALPFMQERFGMGCDVYYRRRLSVCRTLIDLDIHLSDDRLDTLLAVSVSHYLPLDKVPADQDEIKKLVFAGNPKTEEIFEALKYSDRADEEAYMHLRQNPNALMIRLAERAVLVESLYEWPEKDARRYIAETRRFFFPMCAYAKEHCPEFIAPATIITEKMRNLIAANEALLNRYEEIKVPLMIELAELEKENADLKAQLEELGR